MGRPYVIFQVEGFFFALPCETILEVLPMAELFIPPQTPAILAGFLNLEGKALPVLAAAGLLYPERKTPRAAGIHAHLILLKGRGQPFILQVDRAEEVRFLPEEEAVILGEKDSLGGCVEARLREGEREIFILAPQKLLLREEEGRLAALRILEEERLRSLEPGFA